MINKLYMSSLRKKAFLFFLFIHKKIHVSSHQDIDTLQGGGLNKKYIQTSPPSTCYQLFSL